MREAQYYQRNGDYGRAVREYQDVASNYPHSLEARDALLGLAQANHLAGEYREAIKALEGFLEVFPGDEHVNQAIFFIGSNYGRSGDWRMAIAYYELYLSRKAEPLAGYASLYAGEGYFQLQMYDNAAQRLQDALAAGLPRVTTIDAMEKIGDSYFRMGGYRAAAEWYEEILDRAASSSYKADISYRLGKAYAALGNSGHSRDVWEDIIENYPATPFALSALETISEGNPPTYYHRGLVYYHNNRLDSAIAAFDKYLVDHPQGEYVASSQYYRALAYSEKGDKDRAVAELSDVARTYAGSAVAGEALFQLGRVFEASARYEEAAQHYASAADGYPNQEFAQDALFRQGLCYYKQLDFFKATQAWDLVLRRYPSSRSTAKALFWVGKTMRDKIGDQQIAKMHLDQVVLAASWDYYGAKAKYLAQNVPDFPSYRSDPNRDDLVTESAAEKNDFEIWLHTWSGRDFYSFQPDSLILRKDPLFRRAEELVRVGLRTEVQEEFWGLEAKYKNDPVALYEMAEFFRQNGLYHLSMAAAGDLVVLSPPGDVHAVPRFLQKLVYPMYFAELLVAESDKAGIDPLLLAAVIRQESRFDQFAESSAEARGLMQVIPSTAKGIADALALKQFTGQDLYKPFVSIAFGAYYLGEELRNLDNKLLLALAAYNAGAGSVNKWTNGDMEIDTDVFVEDIRFAETQKYVKIIYQEYDFYKQVYGPPSFDTR